MYRTHTCGCLRAENVNQTVTLAGWVQKVRNLGAMTFIDLRDRYGITQVVIEERSPAEARQTACCVGREWVIQVVGKVIERQSKNPRMATGDIEVAAQKVTILHEAEVPPFTIEEVSDGGDDLRMKYRYLDLRRPPLQRNMILRHKMAQEIRRFLDAEGFLEIETPYLVNSTPEASRDFVVPSRMNPNQFYALFPDRALLPRRRPARRPPARVHTDRLRDVVRRAGRRAGDFRALGQAHVQGGNGHRTD